MKNLHPIGHHTKRECGKAVEGKRASKKKSELEAIAPLRTGENKDCTDVLDFYAYRATRLPIITVPRPANMHYGAPLFLAVLLGLFMAPVAYAAAPIEKIPEWGAMTTPAEYNRTFAKYGSGDLIDPPAYDLDVLTGTKISELSGKKRTPREIKILTAKLFYSTRYCGTYDLDAGEYVEGSTHCAIDLKAPKGTPVHAVVTGKAQVVKNKTGYGIHVIVTTRSGDRWIYGHMSKATARNGRNVRAGQVIGEVGSTGRSTSPHLHLELQDKNGTNKSPVPFLPYK